MHTLKEKGIHKIFLVMFDRNKDGNIFWKKQCLEKEKI